MVVVLLEPVPKEIKMIAKNAESGAMKDSAFIPCCWSFGSPQGKADLPFEAWRTPAARVLTPTGGERTGAPASGGPHGCRPSRSG